MIKYVVTITRIHEIDGMLKKVTKENTAQNQKTSNLPSTLNSNAMNKGIKISTNQPPFNIKPPLLLFSFKNQL